MCTCFAQIKVLRTNSKFSGNHEGNSLGLAQGIISLLSLLKFTQECFKVISKSQNRGITFAIDLSSDAMCFRVVIKLK